MSHDNSRKIFNPLDDYFGVVMQQGRVQVDVDWNTMVDQFRRRLQAESLDTFGTSVVPRETADGFLISGPVAAFEIGPGRIYVDGILAENHTDTLKWDARLAEIAGSAKLSGADVDATPSGMVGTTSYNNQPYYPDPPALPAGNYLVYVDVWQRDITYLQDARLVDVAVGVDTTARQQTVWQVKFLDNVGALEPTVADVDIPGWLETIHPSSARLSTATGDLIDDDNPCLLPPQAGYKGLENQLYRVQVHTGGPIGSATFKWSRDNAIVASRISAIAVNGLDIVVDSLGRDSVLSFHEGDWVEITDDYREFKGIPGELRRIQLSDGIDSATRTITLEGDPLVLGLADGEFHIDDSDSPVVPARNTRIIRWDQAGIVFREDETEYTDLNDAVSDGSILVPDSGTRLFLEKGILVDFDLETVVDEADFEAEFKTGDYWIFSARVNDASIELLDRAPPVGIHHHYAKLAIVNDSGIIDCRTLWPPQTGTESCACTVCVRPETHNNGSATIQQAVDQVIAAGGGTVCLSVGEYQISQPVRVTGNSVTLRGQGWQTMLISRNSSTVIEIGGEAVTTDITVEKMIVLTSVVRGFNTAIDVNNVMGLNLSNCFIANIAAEGGTSQGVKFTGLAVMVEVSKCNFIAERGIIGPRLQEEILATMDFTVRDCILACSQQGISFSGLSFHVNKLELMQNHISNSGDAGIQLTGAVLDNTSVDIHNNLLINCLNGMRCGVSNLRILHNDLEVTANENEAGSAIIFEAGLDPDNSDNQQVIGNRIRHYRDHAITVRTGIGKMMVKQNQVEHIFGAAFVIEAGGSIDYLSLENNQFSDVSGVFAGTDDRFAAVFLQASVRADITNNLFDSVVRSDNPVSIRAGIIVSSSGDVRITGNRLFSVTPANYTGIGAGIIISSGVGSFEVNNNEVSRVPESDDKSSEKISSALWLPLIVLGAIGADNNVSVSASRLTEARFVNLRSNVSELATSLASMDRIPVVNVNETAYAVLTTSLANLGTAALSNNNITVNDNHLDATSSTTSAAIISVSAFCGFSDNEVKSTNSDVLVHLVADHIAANNNRLLARIDGNILIIQSRKYAAMGNMSMGNIAVFENGTLTSLPDPWKSLNINI